MAERKNKPATNKRSAPANFSMPNWIAPLKMLLRSSLVIGCLLAVFYLATYSRSFYQEIWPVEEVVLQGDFEYLNANNLIAFVNGQAVKGMLAIDLEQLQKDTLKLDWVAAVEIRKVWPQQLVFNLKEENPIARIGNSVLTQTGKQIKQGEDELKFSHLPQLNLADSSLDNNELLDLWKAFKHMKRQLELVALKPDVMSVDVINNWQLDLANGLTLNLGRKLRQERVARLVKVFPTIKNKAQIQSIDLRYSNGLSVEWLETKEADLKS